MKYKLLPVHSFRFRMAALVTAAMCLLVGALVFTNSYAIQVIRDRVYQMTRQNIHMQQSQISSDFSNVENYLAGLNMSNPDIHTLESGSNQLSWSLAVTRLQSDLVKALPSFSSIDGLFIYSGNAKVWFDAFRSGLPNKERLAARDHFIRLHQEGSLFHGERTGNWFPEEIGSGYVFFRVLQFRETYVGAWVTLDYLLEPLRGNAGDSAESFFFCGENGVPLDRALRNDQVVLSFDNHLHHYRLSEDVNRYLMIHDKSPFGPYYLVVMVRDNSILEGLGSFGAMLVIILAVVAVIHVALLFMMHRWMVRPLRRLTDNLNALQEGNFSVRIHDDHPYEEFAEVNNAFNEMIDRIETLKINVYVEQLAKQASQLLYLQQQVTPHMFINCLNTIYSLASTGRTDLLKKLSLDLSTHLRYVLSSRPLVPLEREIVHVENYVALNVIRYPGSIRCSIDVPAAARAALVPPLLLQTLVENAIKHEAEVGKPLDIRIEAQVAEDGRLHICLWDTGRGFPPEVLRQLREGGLESAEEGYSIGLNNIIRRLTLQYGGDRMGILFSNRPDAGAQIDIWLPLNAGDKEGEADER